MAFPAANSRRIFNTVSNTNIPISPPDIRQARSLDHRDEGSFFDADHPATGVPFPRRSTDKLRGTANDGTTPLVGNEIALANYSVAFQTKLVRQATNVQITEELKTELDLRAVNKSALQRYAAELLKNDLNGVMNSIPVVNPTAGLEDLSVLYSGATAANLNAFCAANASNRDWATMLLAQQQIDTPEVRKALLTAAKDENNVVRAEALLGLAHRDPSVALPLVRQELTGNVACMALFEAATELASPMLIDVLRLWSEPSDNPFLDGWASEALAACVNAAGQG